MHLFSKNHGAIAVVWSDQDRKLALKDATVLNLMGNEEPNPRLRPGEPVFVIAPRLQPEQLGAALKSGEGTNR